MTRIGVVLMAVMICVHADAASIMKCMDAAGNVTFTKNANCPRNSGLADVVSANNAAPSGSSEAVRMASPNSAPVASYKSKELTVVGQPQQRTLPIDNGLERETPVRRAGVNRNAAQPCVRFVDKHVSSSRRGKNGGTIGRGEVIKVPVPC